MLLPLKCKYFIGRAGRNSRGVVANELDCGFEVSKFEFQSRYYAHVRISILGKGMNHFILPAMGYIVPRLFFYKGGLDIK